MSMALYRTKVRKASGGVAPGPSPLVLGFSPSSAPIGATVTITGTNFVTGSTSVTINGTAATSVLVLSTSSLTCVVASGTTSGGISVTTPLGTGSSASSFTVATDIPTIAGFSPSVGPVGTSVGVVGTNFVIGATTVTVGGVTASVVTVSSSGYLTFTVPVSAVTGSIAVTTSGGTGTSSSPYTVGTATADRYLSRTNPTTGVTTQIEYARGVTSTYDVTINETTGTIAGTVWNWAPERYGAARHTAISANRITVTTTGSTGWTDFKNAVITARAGSGDWEIVLPVSAPITQDQQYDLSFPDGRRLYITATTRQTADAMPSLAGSFATFDGPNFQRAYQFSVQGQGNNITFTGIRWRALAEYANTNILIDNDAATTVSQMPKQIVFDRCWIDGNDRNDGRRGIRAEAQQLAMLETWITDISLNAETTGIHAWDGAGFQYYRNVMTEAAGIGIMFGADAPTDATFIPHDILCYRVASAKREKWMPGGLFDGRTRTIKNNWECKKVKRWTVFECASVNHRDDLGQSHSMIIKNGNPGGLDTTQDVAVLRHDFYRVANGFSFLGRGTEETTDLTRVAAVDLRFRDVGYYAAGGSTQPWSLQGPVDGFIYDRVTEIIAPAKTVSYGHPFYGSGGNARNVWMANTIMRSGDGLAGGPAGFTAVYGTEGVRTGWGQAANCYVGANVFYGGNALFNKATAYPQSTEYADAAAAGINATTGALTGDITTRGVGGSTPGAKISAIDTFVAAMSWAYGR